MLDYLEVITDPIGACVLCAVLASSLPCLCLSLHVGPITTPTTLDLSLIESRVKEGDYYRSREMLLADLLRMCRNCKVYNNPNTEYYS